MDTARTYDTAAAGIELRPFNQLGHADHGWLDAHHHFSFGGYHDPERMGWGLLRVVNDDRVAAGKGFGMHPHQDMEIITYVRSGAISHSDSLGNHGVTKAGDVQVMSAGRGIVHSEWNEGDVPVTLYQIWIYPNQKKVEPRWEAREFPQQPVTGKTLPLLVTSMTDESDSQALRIYQDAFIYGGIVNQGGELAHDIPEGYVGYVLVAWGKVRVNGVTATERDGIAIGSGQHLAMYAEEDAELLLIVVPEWTGHA